MSEKEAQEQIRQLVAELRVLEGAARITRSQLDIVNASVTELALAASTLEGLKGAKEDIETLVPIGGGSYLPTVIPKTDRTIVGIGAGVCIERSMDDALQELKARREELEKVRKQLQDQLLQTVARVEDIRNALGTILGRTGGVALV